MNAEVSLTTVGARFRIDVDGIDHSILGKKHDDLDEDIIAGQRQLELSLELDQSACVR